MSLVNIQDGSQEHHNFIKATWLKTYFSSGSRFCENMTPEVYYAHHPELLEKILKRSKVLVAQSKNDPDVTVGYLVYEPDNVIHFVYVKHTFRRFGVATSLLIRSGLRPDACSYTHRTGDCVWVHGSYYKEIENGQNVRKFRDGKYPGLTYDPYGAFNE